MGSGDKAAISICVYLATTSFGAVMSLPVVSSGITERSIGREVVLVTPSAVRIRDLSATLGFLINMRSMALSYRMRRRLRACRISIRVTLRRPLNHVWNRDGVVSSTVTKSFLCRIPREARFLEGREISVRIGIGVLTSDHRALCGEVPYVISSGWRDARLDKRRRVFTRWRILST